MNLTVRVCVCVYKYRYMVSVFYSFEYLCWLPVFPFWGYLPDVLPGSSGNASRSSFQAEKHTTKTAAEQHQTAVQHRHVNKMFETNLNDWPRPISNIYIYICKYKDICLHGRSKFPFRGTFRTSFRDLPGFIWSRLKIDLFCIILWLLLFASGDIFRTPFRDLPVSSKTRLPWF